MAILKPYILSSAAREQGVFYTEALGGEAVSVLTHGEVMGAQSEMKDKIMHMCIRVAGDNYIFLADAMAPTSGGSNLVLSVEFAAVEEARSAFANLAEGGRVTFPLELQPFGMYIGQLTDKYGIGWMITTEQKA
ncbi:VOC family protein [Paenibacillus sp. IB182496]|uniref:VOC family protein n=1 Tax=Paenibacillus sabuli TaxID=2772509 RepID=A0A927BTG2_9BACL|nr:VOC family protein [Paenibacillus sabuli]MBD2845365.1 VOC family protein [Paenibacillus sabuli]